MLKQEKPKHVDDLTSMLENYSVIGMLNMHKMPARALQQMRESMRGQAVIKMSRRSMLKKAMQKSSKKNIKMLEDKMTKVPALLLTNENPFRLFKLLKENRTPAAAKTGDVEQLEKPERVFICE